MRVSVGDANWLCVYLCFHFDCISCSLWQTKTHSKWNQNTAMQMQFNVFTLIDQSITQLPLWIPNWIPSCLSLHPSYLSTANRSLFVAPLTLFLRLNLRVHWPKEGEGDGDLGIVVSIASHPLSNPSVRQSVCRCSRGVFLSSSAGGRPTLSTPLSFSCSECILGSILTFRWRLICVFVSFVLHAINP